MGSPFGTKHQFLSSAPSWILNAVGNWQLSGILTWDSGAPLNVATTTMYPVGFSPQDPGKGGLNGASLSLSDLVSALPKNSGEVAVGNGFVQYFPGLTTKPAPANALGSDPDNIKGRNTNQIVVDSAGNTVFQNPAPGTVGNVGLAYLTGPTHLGLNMALQKLIHVREGMTMTLRGDAVNILNKPVWGDPNLDINSANFGRITTATGARSITINARIDF